MVYPNQVFHYPQGDQAARSQAQQHGRDLGIPEPQLDWTTRFPPVRRVVRRPGVIPGAASGVVRG